MKKIKQFFITLGKAIWYTLIDTDEDRFRNKNVYEDFKRFEKRNNNFTDVNDNMIGLNKEEHDKWHKTI